MNIFDIEALHPVLQRCLFTGQLGPVINHPYLVRPYVERFNAIFNRQYLQQRREIAQAKAAGNWTQVVWLHERPYRPLALYQIGRRMSDEQFWRMVSEVWIDSENHSQNAKVWQRLWLTERPRREQVMTQNEHHELSRLPDPLVIFRGCQDAESMLGLSWTVSRKKAIWFANRLPRARTKPVLATAQIMRKSVQAYFFDQGEFEVVVLPDDLRYVTSTKVRPELAMA